jgi:RNA polymerase sigma-70 factor, ECF subfamily
MRRMDHAAAHPGLLVTAHDELAREAEFERLVRENADLAVRIAFSVLRQREDAEDIAQEAFARAHAHFAEFHDPGHFRGWIVRTTWRLAIDRWRGDRRRMKREQIASDLPAQRSLDEHAAERQRAERLWDAIDALPEKLRIAIVLSAMRGHDVATIARVLDVPEGTVKSRLFLARKALAERLQCLANDFPRR